MKNKQNKTTKYEAYTTKFRNVFSNMIFFEACKFLIINYFIAKIRPRYFSYVLKKDSFQPIQKRENFSIKEIKFFKQISEKDLKVLKEKTTYSNLFTFNKSFSNDATLWLGYLNGNLVGYGWSNKIKKNVSGYRNAIRVFDMEIFSEYRFKGAGSLLLQKICKVLFVRRFQNILSEVHFLNKPSIRMYESQGFKIYKKI